MKILYHDQNSVIVYEIRKASETLDTFLENNFANREASAESERLDIYITLNTWYKASV